MEARHSSAMWAYHTQIIMIADSYFMAPLFQIVCVGFAEVLDVPKNSC